MYKLTVKDSVFTIPKESIIMFALHKALENGITYGKIHDSETAIEYLESIGIKIECIGSETDLTEIPKMPQWNNSQHRGLYDKLFYRDIDRELTDEEEHFVKTMYHMEEYACGLDGD